MKVVDIIKVCEPMVQIRLLREIYDVNKKETYKMLITEYTDMNEDILMSEVKSIGTSNKGLFGTLLIII